MATLYESPEMAAGYAAARPPIHREILAKARPHLERLGLAVPARRALDVGCGAGLSTRALGSLAQECLGIDPSPAMVRCATSVVPEGRFQVGRAESLPLAAASIDLITAAGSLNYADLDRFFPEAVRALAPGGALVVYDFGQGRASHQIPGLEPWFQGFLQRYPMPSDDWRELSPEALGNRDPRLPLAASERFEIGVPLTLERYTDYLLTESNVAEALARGAVASELRCLVFRELEPLFGGNSIEVLFPGYLAVLGPVR
ncbi:MAG: class I SAM-dependent methyltransferase [Verrucomicrobiales bacterium]|nr:class I SAM-dependent methyltransferase [Verrucomicrobiales bacterium]